MIIDIKLYNYKFILCIIYNNFVVKELNIMSTTSNKNEYVYELPKKVTSFLKKTCGQINKEIENYANRLNRSVKKNSNNTKARFDTARQSYNKTTGMANLEAIKKEIQTKINSFTTLTNYLVGNDNNEYTITASSKSGFDVPEMSTDTGVKKKFESFITSCMQISSQDSDTDSQGNDGFEKNVDGLFALINYSEQKYTKIKHNYKKHMSTFLKYETSLIKKYNNKTFENSLSELNMSGTLENSYTQLLVVGKQIKAIWAIAGTCVKKLQDTGYNFSNNNLNVWREERFQEMFYSLTRSADKVCLDCITNWVNQRKVHETVEKLNKKFETKTTEFKNLFDKDSTANENQQNSDVLINAWNEGLTLNVGKQNASLSDVNQGLTVMSKTQKENIADQCNAFLQQTRSTLTAMKILELCKYKEFAKTCDTIEKNKDAAILGLCRNELDKLIGALSSFEKAFKKMKLFCSGKKIWGVVSSISNFMKENAVVIASIGCLTSFFATTVGCLPLGCIIAGVTLFACLCRLLDITKKHCASWWKKRKNKNSSGIHEKARGSIREAKNIKVVIFNLQTKLDDAKDSETVSVGKNDLEALLKFLNKNIQINYN